MEKDDEVKGIGNSYDFGARMYDPRIGRWLSMDPLFKSFVDESPFIFSGNSPIWYKDINGEYKWKYSAKVGRDGAVRKFGEHQRIGDLYFEDDEWHFNVIQVVNDKEVVHKVSSYSDLYKLQRNYRKLGLRKSKMKTYEWQKPKGGIKAVEFLVETLGDPLPGLPGTDVGFTPLIQKIYDEVSEKSIEANDEISLNGIQVLSPKINNEVLSAEKEFASPVTYGIKWGDTLSEIAKKNNVSIETIMENNSSIENPDLIYAGNEIVIK